jgi:hypothetical protein
MPTEYCPVCGCTSRHWDGCPNTPTTPKEE